MYGIYIWYVCIPYMHSALFVHDAIFPHVIHVKRSSYMLKDIAKLATFESWAADREAQWALSLTLRLTNPSFFGFHK